jgi:hypothetical protein
MDNRSFSSTALFGPFPVHQPIPVAHHCVTRLSSASAVAVSMDIIHPYSHSPSMPARRPPRRAQHPSQQALKWITAPSLQRSINTSPAAHHSIPRLSPASTVAISMDIICPYSQCLSMPARRPTPRAQHPSRQTLKWKTAPSRCSGCHQHQHKPRGSSFCPTAVIGINCCCCFRHHPPLFPHPPIASKCPLNVDIACPLSPPITSTCPLIVLHDVLNILPQ